MTVLRAASGGKWETKKGILKQQERCSEGLYNHTAAFADHNHWNSTGANLSVSNLHKPGLGGALCYT